MTNPMDDKVIFRRETGTSRKWIIYPGDAGTVKDVGRWSTLVVTDAGNMTISNNELAYWVSLASEVNHE